MANSYATITLSFIPSIIFRIPIHTLRSVISQLRIPDPLTEIPVTQKDPSSFRYGQCTNHLVHKVYLPAIKVIALRVL